MNIVVISEENRILHIINYGYEVQYVVYNVKAQVINEGVLESISGIFDSYKVVREIIKLVQESITFSSPFIYMYGDETDLILRLIDQEKSKRDKSVLNFIKSLANASDYFSIYRERIEYA